MKCSNSPDLSTHLLFKVSMNPIHIRINTGEEDGGAGQGHLEGPGRGGAGEVQGRGLLRVPRGPLHVMVFKIE